MSCIVESMQKSRHLLIHKKLNVQFTLNLVFMCYQSSVCNSVYFKLTVVYLSLWILRYLRVLLEYYFLWVLLEYQVFQCSRYYLWVSLNTWVDTHTVNTLLYSTHEIFSILYSTRVSKSQYFADLCYYALVHIYATYESYCM